MRATIYPKTQHSNQFLAHFRHLLHGLPRKQVVNLPSDLIRGTQAIVEIEYDRFHRVGNWPWLVEGRPIRYGPSAPHDAPRALRINRPAVIAVMALA